MTTVGLCFGGYCPLHQGHLDLIMQAKKENDLCCVIVCGYTNEPRGKELGLDLNDRFRLVSEFFSEDEQVRVFCVNDTDLGIDESMSLENWKIWQGEVKRQVWADDSTYTWYVAEPEYRESIIRVNVFEAQIKLLRKTLQVSGTQIREEPWKYWRYITAPFKPHLCQNILVLGTASEGKSTLVRDISRYFDIPYSPEFGREYMVESGLKDTDLTKKEFEIFLEEQAKDGENKIHKSGRPVYISDTDSTVTLMYAKAYSQIPEILGITSDDYSYLHSYALQRKDRIRWDHIFVFPPKKEFKDDGVRYMGQSGMEERKGNYEILSELLVEFYPYVPKTYLSGSFLDNFNVVKRYVQSFII